MRRSSIYLVDMAVFTSGGGMFALQRENLIVIKVCQSIMSIMTTGAVTAILCSVLGDKDRIFGGVTGAAIQRFSAEIT